MEFNRRTFVKGAVTGLAAVVGPWSLAGRTGHAATGDTPALKFLTPSEYTYINRMAREIVPDEPVLDGTVDVAKNLDWFFAEKNASPDFLIMFRFLRLIRLADPVLPVLNRVAPATAEDIMSFKRTICFLGYYSDANGEAEVASGERVVWPHHHNPCNQIMIIGAQREGIKWKSVDRPVTMCLRCGNCTQGCRYGVKQDMQKTFLTWARAHDMDAYCGARVDNIKINFPDVDDFPYKDKLAGGAAKDDVLRELQNRKNSAPAKFTLTAAVTDRKAAPPRDGKLPEKSITVHAHKLVLAAGPIGDTRLLLKSKINPHGVVGKKFSTHPTSFNVGRFDRNIALNGWDGTNDTIEVHHYSDLFRHESYYDRARHGFLLEAALSLPWGIANLLPGSGAEHLELMRDMNHMAGMEVNVKTDQYGRITEDGIDFDMSERDNEAMLYGTWIVARLFFRTGAKQVFTGLPGLVLTSPTQLDQIFKYKRGKQKGFLQKQANLYSGHIFGGAIMGIDPQTSFCGQTGECHAIKNLWVADGAAFPTNVGVNCALSISTVARKIADDFFLN